MSVKLAKLEWYGFPKDQYCPVCGAAIFLEDKDPKKCEHVLFAYLDHQDRFEDFLYINDKIRKNVEEIVETSCKNPVKALLKKMESTSILCYAIKTNGHSCGFEDSSTLYLAIDFHTEEEAN